MFKKHEITWNAESIGNLWNYYANSHYYNNYYFNKVLGIYVIKFLSNKIQLDGKGILDYGSGPGYLFEKLLQLRIKARYSALDFSSESLRILKEKFSRQPLFDGAYHVDGIAADLKKKYDIIIASELIEHLDDNNLNKAIIQMKELLKDGGIIYVTTPNEEDLEAQKLICPECGCIYHKWQHVRSWSKESLAKFMTDQGLETVTIEAWHFAGLTGKFKHYVKKLINKGKQKPHLAYLGRLA